jgi:CO/xanthine dehydrogenase Mo-binding subunit
MSSTAGTVAGGSVMAGHNRISTQALTSLARAAAAEALGVPAHDVRADWSDDDGLLALSLVLPIRIPPLTTVLRDPGRVGGFGGSIWERTVAAKAVILQRVAELSGAQLSRVDIRISGAAISEGGRVQ